MTTYLSMTGLLSLTDCNEVCEAQSCSLFSLCHGANSKTLSYTRWTIKTCQFVFDYNADVSSAIRTILVSVKTRAAEIGFKNLGFSFFTKKPKNLKSLNFRFLVFFSKILKI